MKKKMVEQLRTKTANHKLDVILLLSWKNSLKISALNSNLYFITIKTHMS